MSELSNFQKNFLAGSGHVEVFTQKEFDDALTLAKAEIMTVAIQTTKQAIHIEREECAKILEEEMLEQDIAMRGVLEVLAERIRNRIPAQRQ
jgi:thiazole synthase ThiGH ThiG subunit